MVEASKKARQQINAELGLIGKGAGSGSGAGAFGDLVRASRKAAQDSTAAQQRELSRQASDLMRNLAIRKRALEEQAREEERIAQRKARAIDHVLAVRQRFEREQLRAVQRDQESFGRRTSYSTIQHVGGTMRGASQVAKDIARGAGVQTDIGALVGSNVNLQKRAIDLSNAAYMPGAAGAAGQRVDAGVLMAQAREIGNFAAFDPGKVLEGLQAFVAKTGDLQTGRESLQDMAQLSRATGTALDDMVDAAGDVANALGNVENKGAKTAAVMRVIAGQGKIGAVEIKQLAVQMAKLGAAATQFEGDPQENLAVMGALAQMSRAKGGSATATQAATSVASLVNIFKTPARMKAFQAATGKSVFNPATGMLRPVEEMILESLKATGGRPDAMKKIFANTGGARAVEGFATVFRQAGGGDKGLAAVRAEFDKFKQIAMGRGEIEGSFTRSMKGDEAKIQLFNNKLGEVGAKLAERVLPQMERLAPAVLDAVDGLGKLVAWTAENPLKAVFAALGTSILRGAAEAAIRSGVESSLRGLFGGASGTVAGGIGTVSAQQFIAGPGGAGGKLLSAGGTAIAVAAAAFTIYEVGTLAIDKVLDMSNKAEEKTQEAMIGAVNARQALLAEQRAIESIPENIRDPNARPSLQAINNANAEEEMLAARIANAEKFGDVNPVAAYMSHAANYVSGGAVGRNIDAANLARADAAQLADMKAELASLRATMERTFAGELKVRVSNMPAAGPPEPSGARVGMDLPLLTAGL